MEKKSHYLCRDGRSYDVTMRWDENFKPSDKILAVLFTAVDRESGRPLTLPRDIATYALGDAEESLGERLEHYFHNDRELMLSEYLTSAYRRATDWIERGR